METREILRSLRKETGLTQREFAELFSIVLGTYKQWELGMRKPPEYIIKMIEKIFEYKCIKYMKIDLNKSVRETLRELRQRTGLSQRAFAEKFSIPKITYEGWEQEVNKPPIYTLKMLAAIIEYESKYAKESDKRHAKECEEEQDKKNDMMARRIRMIRRFIK